jgi:hypothetical protein
MNTDRISNIVMFGLMAVGVLLLVLGLAVDQEYFSQMLYYTYFLAIVAALGWIGGMLTSVVMNPSSIKGILIWVGAFAVVIGIGYGLSSGEIMEGYPIDITESTVRLSGMGLYILYLVFIGAVGAILFSWVWGFIRK